MTEASTSNTRRRLEFVFECEICASRQLARIVEYNWLGYPICPACEHEHGPHPGDGGRTRRETETI